MPANFESGVTYGEKSWHGLENNLPADDPRRHSVAGTLEASGMDWGVKKVRQSFLVPDANGTIVVDGVNYARQRSSDFAIVRDDNWNQVGTASEDYDPLNNRELFEFFQPFLDNRSLQFESAGALDGGRRVYVQASLAGGPRDIGGGDFVAPKLLLASSHDRSLATSTLWTPERVVCANTLSAALKNFTSQLRVKHTSGQRKALKSIQEIVDTANRDFAATCEQFTRLKECDINRDDLHNYVRKVLKIDPELALDEVPTRTRNQFDKIVSLALRGKGQVESELTAWSAYNGVTEWTTHYRQKDAETRQKSVWFGTSRKTSERALDLAVQLAS